MTPSTSLPARDPARLKALALRPATRQKLLAFASLIVLMVFFSLASPNFLQTDNMVTHPAGHRGQRRAGDRRAPS